MIVEYIRNFVQKYDSYEIYEKYSGKGMFGRHCIGIIVKKGSSYMDCLIKLTSYLQEQGYDDVDFKLEGIRVDDLGLDTIIYFPNIEC